MAGNTVPSFAMFAFVFYIGGHAGGLSKLCHKCMTDIQKKLNVLDHSDRGLCSVVGPKRVLILVSIHCPNNIVTYLKFRKILHLMGCHLQWFHSYEIRFSISVFLHWAVMYMYFFYEMIMKIHSVLVWMKVLNVTIVITCSFFGLSFYCSENVTAYLCCYNLSLNWSSVLQEVDS